MKHLLREKASTLPCLPGVYLMKDSQGSVIYVGKSKELRKRVGSYFGSDKGHSPKVKRLVRHIKSFDYEVVDTEFEALLRECELIKTLKPIYNRLLKEDKKYCYLVVCPENPLPRAEIAYEKGKEGLYFGPYDRKQGLVEAVQALNTYYQWPTCKEVLPKEGCLSFLSGKCIGCCDPQIREEQVPLRLERMIDFLKGGNEEPLFFCEKKMQEAALNLAFEKANFYKNNLSSLKALRFRKEAVAYSLSHQKGLLFMPKPTGGIKVYGLQGTTVLFSNEVEKEEVTSSLKDQLLQEATEPRVSLRKEEVDAAYIVYSYIQGKGDSTYIPIEE